MNQKRLSLSKALIWILLSIVWVSGSATLAWLYYLHLRSSHINDDAYRIVAIVQTGPEREALKTVYLAELLNLSIDQPSNLYRFDTKEAQSKLLASPLIKEAYVKKILPGTIYVDYSLRQPVAFLGDYSNTAIDDEGSLFPFHPFFTPKKLPVMYFGLDSKPSNGLYGSALLGSKLERQKKDLAFALLKLLNTEYCSESSHVLRIDVSKAFADSYGQRQVVVVLEDWFEKEQNGRKVLCLCPRILRLTPDQYLAQLANYHLLKKYLLQQEEDQAVDGSQDVVKAEPMVIDLRMAQFALIQER